MTSTRNFRNRRKNTYVDRLLFMDFFACLAIVVLSSQSAALIQTALEIKDISPPSTETTKVALTIYVNDEGKISTDAEYAELLDSNALQKLFSNTPGETILVAPAANAPWDALRKLQATIERTGKHRAVFNQGGK